MPDQLSLFDKRWLRRQERWRSPGELFRAAPYAVDVIAEEQAKRFVCEHHYSGSYPAGRLAVGLYGPRSRLEGVAVFSEPSNPQVVPSYTGLSRDRGAELGRFVCLPSVRYNGETWFLARAFRLVLLEKGLYGIVSYADPLERTTASGEITKPAHWGTIYQASNAIYAGRATARWLHLAPDGRIVSPRAVSKIRQQEKGHAYAERQLVAMGAAPRAPGEDPTSWVARSLNQPPFRRIRHPGNHAYVFGLSSTAKNEILAHLEGGVAYPKKVAA